MKLIKKLGAVFAAALLFSAAAASVSLAARLEDVTLKFSMGSRNDCTYPELTVTLMEQTLYYVESAAFIDYVNPYTHQPGRYPTAEIVIKPAEGYAFKSSSQSYFALLGLDAKYIEARKSGDSKTLTLTVEFRTMGNSTIAPPSNVTLDNNGLASWSPVDDAGSYEVTLLRNGKADNSTKNTVTGTSLNIGSMVNRTGDYSVRVAAISRYDTKVKSSYSQSGPVLVDDSVLAGFSANAASYENGAGRWVESNGNYWYENPDGTWPASGWQEIDGSWYFFNSQGYRQTGWILWKNQQYYCDSDGKMLVDAITPDGYYVDGNGIWHTERTGL